MNQLFYCFFGFSKDIKKQSQVLPKQLEMKAGNTKKDKATKPGYKLSYQLLTLNYTCMEVRLQEPWKAETAGRLRELSRLQLRSTQGDRLELEFCQVRGITTGFPLKLWKDHEIDDLNRWESQDYGVYFRLRTKAKDTHPKKMYNQISSWWSLEN